jgi:hypothetical protein
MRVRGSHVEVCYIAGDPQAAFVNYIWSAGTYEFTVQWLLGGPEPPSWRLTVENLDHTSTQIVTVAGTELEGTVTDGDWQTGDDVLVTLEALDTCGAVRFTIGPTATVL